MSKVLTDRKGFYINALVSGDFGGGDGFGVRLVYGAPNDNSPRPVHPVENGFELLRFNDTSKQKNIFIVRYDLSEPVHLWHYDRRLETKVRATPALHRIFDEMALEWRRQVEIYWNEVEQNRESNNPNPQYDPILVRVDGIDDVLDKIKLKKS